MKTYEVKLHVRKHFCTWKTCLRKDYE